MSVVYLKEEKKAVLWRTKCMFCWKNWNLRSRFCGNEKIKILRFTQDDRDVVNTIFFVNALLSPKGTKY